VLSVTSAEKSRSLACARDDKFLTTTMLIRTGFEIDKIRFYYLLKKVLYIPYLIC